MIKLSDYIVEFIARQKVGHIFEMVGGAITHLVDSVHARRDIQCVSMHHEQAAAFAAEAYARVNGKLGVAMATSGPGALNMLTPIGSCYFDSVPCLFITGQVNTYEYKFDRPVRQIGFQETDIVSVVKPLVKYSELVSDFRKIRYCLEKAVFLARSGRPGPVLLDIPMNVQRAQIEPGKLKSFYGSAEHRRFSKRSALSRKTVKAVATAISKASRPIILVGGGVRSAGAVPELSKLLRKTGIPVVSSLMGLDAVDHAEKSFTGMLGSYGTRYTNMAVANCDLLLVLGSRLDTRQTGARYDTFARGAQKIHIDIDPHELGAKIKPDIAVKADLKEFLSKLLPVLAPKRKNSLVSWYSVISGYRKSFPEVETPKTANSVNPNEFMHMLSAQSRPGDIVCVDVGQNQMWAAQSFRLKRGQRMLISGGMGSMGFSLPAAIGAALAAPNRRVIVVCGDGGIQVNIQDMDSLPARKLPIKIILMNNGCLGMVRHFQDLYFGGRRQSTLLGYHCPDLKGIIGAYGVPGRTTANMSDVEKQLRAVMSSPGPALLEIKLSVETTVEPKLEFNRPIEDMSPNMPREKLRKSMLIEPLLETE